MRLFSKLLIFSFSCLILVSNSALAITGWDSLESEHFRILFPKAHREQAVRVLQSFELAHLQIGGRFVKDKIPGQARDDQAKQDGDDHAKRDGNQIGAVTPGLTRSLIAPPTTPKMIIVLEDHGLDANGSVSPHYAQTRLHSLPTRFGLKTLHHHDWYPMLAVHEYTHYLQFSTSTPFYQQLSRHLGGYFVPNAHVPDTLTEGLAVYHESLGSPYQGRLNDGYFHAFYHSRRHFNTLAPVGAAHFNRWVYPGGAWYVYGALLVEDISLNYGSDKLYQAFVHQGGSGRSLVVGSPWPSFGIDRSLQTAGLKTYSQAYSEWTSRDTSTMQQNISSENRLVEGRQVQWSKLVPYNGSFIAVSQAWYQYRPEYPTFFNRILQIDAKAGQATTELSVETGDFLNDIHLHNDQLYYAIHTPELGYSNYSQLSYGQSSRLIRLDIKSRKRKVLFTKPFSSFALTDRGQVYYSVPSRTTFESTLYLADAGTHARVAKIPYMVREMLVHEDRLIFVGKTESSSFNLYAFDLNSNTVTPLLLTPYLEYDITRDSNHLYFTANYNKKHRRYLLDLNTNKVVQLSHSDYSRSGLLQGNNLTHIVLDAHGESVVTDRVVAQDFTPPYGEAPQIALPDVSISTPNVSTIRDNYSLLAQPRFAGFYTIDNRIRFNFTGEDRVQSLNYAFDFNSLSNFSSDIQGKVTSYWFSPLAIEFSSLSQGYTERFNQLKATLPLYQSGTKGLQSVSAYILNDFNEIQSIGTIISQYNPLVNTEVQYETNLSKSGSSFSIMHEWRHNPYSLSHRWTTVSNYLFNSPNRGGVSYTFLNQSGDVHVIDFVAPVWTINKSMWSPNILVDQVYLNPFYEHSNFEFSTGDISIYQYGVQFQVNVYHSLDSHALLFLGLSRNQRDETSIFYGISLI